MFKAFLAASLLGTGGPAAAAVNLIVNGGFETGSFAGWTRFGPLAREASRVVRPAALDGAWGARFSANNAYAGIRQTFATPNYALTRYTINYLFRHSAGRARFPQYGFQISLLYPGSGFGGDSLDEYHNRFAEFYDFIEWQSASFTVRVAAPVTTLSFGFFDIYSTAWDLDSISVTEVPFVITEEPARPAVPEPDSWAMLIAGFGAIGVALRRRLAKTAVVAAGVG